MRLSVGSCMGKCLDTKPGARGSGLPCPPTSEIWAGWVSRALRDYKRGGLARSVANQDALDALGQMRSARGVHGSPFTDDGGSSGLRHLLGRGFAHSSGGIFGSITIG